MEEFEEDLERLVCKEGHFSLQPSPVEEAKADRLTLVGKVIAEKVINKNKVSVITTKAWSPTKGMFVKVMGENLFLFVFKEESDKRRVECQTPWNIDGFHLILKKPEKNVFPKEMDFSNTIFQIQAHNLPLEYISEENAEKIGNRVGSFLEADLVGVADARWGNFLRIKVELCAKNPLLNGCWMEQAPISDLWIQLESPQSYAFIESNA